MKESLNGQGQRPAHPEGAVVGGGIEAGGLEDVELVFRAPLGLVGHARLGQGAPQGALERLERTEVSREYLGILMNAEKLIWASSTRLHISDYAPPVIVKQYQEESVLEAALQTKLSEGRQYLAGRRREIEDRLQSIVDGERAPATIEELRTRIESLQSRKACLSGQNEVMSLLGLIEPYNSAERDVTNRIEEMQMQWVSNQMALRWKKKIGRLIERNKSSREAFPSRVDAQYPDVLENNCRYYELQMKETLGLLPDVERSVLASIHELRKYASDLRDAFVKA